MDREIKEFYPAAEVFAQGKLERRVRHKPLLGAILTLALGAAGIATLHAVGIIFGAALALFGIYSLIFARDPKVLDIYSDGVIAYKKRDDSMAVYLPYAGIAQWAVSRNNIGAQVIALITPDEEYLYLETYRLVNLRRIFLKHMPGKQA